MNEKTNKTDDQPELFGRTVSTPNRERNGMTVNYRGQFLRILHTAHEAALAAYGEVTEAQTARFLTALGWAFVDPNHGINATVSDAPSPVAPADVPSKTALNRQRKDASLTATATALRSLFTTKGDGYLTHVGDPSLRKRLGKEANMREVGQHLSQIARGEVVVDGVRAESIGLVPLNGDAKGREAYRISKA